MVQLAMMAALSCCGYLHFQFIHIWNSWKTKQHDSFGQRCRRCWMKLSDFAFAAGGPSQDRPAWLLAAGRVVLLAHTWAGVACPHASFSKPVWSAKGSERRNIRRRRGKTRRSFCIRRSQRHAAENMRDLRRARQAAVPHLPGPGLPHRLLQQGLLHERVASAQGAAPPACRQRLIYTPWRHAVAWHTWPASHVAASAWPATAASHIATAAWHTSPVRVAAAGLLLWAGGRAGQGHRRRSDTRHQEGGAHPG